MDLKQLRTFMTVAGLLNFTRAAERLGYTQANVTLHIQQLETEFGGRLFERLGKNTALTPLGRELLPHARAILGNVGALKAAMAGSTGTLTIGAAESLCLYRLPKLLDAFRRRAPDVRINIKLLDCATYLPSLADNSVDILFALGKRLEPADCRTVAARRVPVSVCAHPGHPLAGRRRVTTEDLAKEAFLLTGEGCCYRGIFLEYLATRYAYPHLAMETDSIPVIKKAAAGGLGLCVLPDIAVEGELANGELARLAFREIKWDIAVQVLHHRDKWLSPALTEFLDTVRTARWLS